MQVSNSFPIRLASVDADGLERAFSMQSMNSVRRSSSSSYASSAVTGVTSKFVHVLAIVQAQDGATPMPSKSPTSPTSPTTVNDKLIFSTGLEQPTGPRPPLLLLAAYHMRSLWIPVLILIGCLTGIVFIEDRQPRVGILLLVAVAILAVILYFFLAGIGADRHLLSSIAAEIVDVLCVGPDAPVTMSSDRRVRFVQQEVLHWHNLTGGMSPSDPLFFLARDIATWREAKEGYVVLNSVGIILYCNDAVLQHFQYTREELVSEDIATLIPAPYNRLHRAFMSKYNRALSKQKIVGGTRALPVVNKSGEQSAVELHVEEVFDPKDHAVAVFVGRMTFLDGPPLAEELRLRLAQGLSITAACRVLQRKESYLVINGAGTIVFASDGMPMLVGWNMDQMTGKNISMLMNPKLAKVHDQYLARYFAQVAEAGGAFPESTVVNQGRDLAVLCATGEYIRVWVSVRGLQAPTKRPQDCLLVGSFIYMQSAGLAPHRGSEQGEAAPQRPDSRTSSRGRGSIFSDKSHGSQRQRGARVDGGGITSARAPVSPRGGGLRVTGLVRRKCTMILFDVVGVQSGGEQLSVEYQTFLSLLVGVCSKNGLQIHDPVGDRILVTSNLRSSSCSQRSVVGMVMQQVLQNFQSARSFGMVQVYGAASSLDAQIGVFGKQTVLVGEGYDFCVCMLQLALEARARHGFIDASLHSELQFTYECRLANIVTLHPRQKRSATVPVYELSALKEMSENEWMYQIEEDERKDPLAAWTECWGYLHHATTGPMPGQFHSADVAQRNTPAALECLHRHLRDHEDDPLGQWLQRVLRQGDPAPAAPHTAGKLPYLPHFCEAATPHTAPHARRASKMPRKMSSRLEDV